MTRNLKSLGLAFVAVAALGAPISSSALAAPGELDSEVAAGKTSAVLTGEINTGGNHVFTYKPGRTVRCAVANLEGTVAKATTDATVTPQYTVCKLNDITNIEIKVNGCKYTWTGVANFTANVDIVGCTAGQSIEIVESSCTITIPEQNGLKHVVFANKAGPPKDIEASVTISGITYIGDSGLPGCGEGTGHHSDLTLSGSTTVRAFEDEGLKEPITHNGHKYQPFKCGKQVGLVST